MTLRRIEAVDARTAEVRVSHAYSAPDRTDVGFHAVAEETSEGHDTAIKECIALRLAA